MVVDACEHIKNRRLHDPIINSFEMRAAVVVALLLAALAVASAARVPDGDLMDIKDTISDTASFQVGGSWLLLSLLLGFQSCRAMCISHSFEQNMAGSGCIRVDEAICLCAMRCMLGMCCAADQNKPTICMICLLPRSASLL